MVFADKVLQHPGGYNTSDHSSAEAHKWGEEISLSYHKHNHNQAHTEGGAEKGERYVDDLRFNGEEYRLNYLRRADLLKGGLLQFNMSDQPNLKRGSTDESSPYSFSRASVSSAK